MTSVLALDVATSTGWAHMGPRNGMAMCSGVQEFKLARGESSGMRFLRFRKWLHDVINTTKPEVIAFERPSFFRSQAAGECIHGLLAIMHEEAAAAKIETLPVSTATLKKHATGKGNAKKEAMIKAAEHRWKLTKGRIGHDEADALCVLAWALEELGERGGTPDVGDKENGVHIPIPLPLSPSIKIRKR